MSAVERNASVLLLHTKREAVKHRQFNTLSGKSRDLHPSIPRACIYTEVLHHFGIRTDYDVKMNVCQTAGAGISTG